MLLQLPLNVQLTPEFVPVLLILELATFSVVDSTVDVPEALVAMPTRLPSVFAVVVVVPVLALVVVVFTKKLVCPEAAAGNPPVPMLIA